MSYKSELLEKLIKAADNPQNEFDGIIGENRAALKEMDEYQLSDIYALRRKAERLCRRIPFSREEIKLLIQSNEVRADSMTAELENCFSEAEYVFSKVSGGQN